MGAAFFPFGEVSGAEIQNGQGVVGAVMLSCQPVMITDLSSSWEVQDPNLANNGVATYYQFVSTSISGTLAVTDGAGNAIGSTGSILSIGSAGSILCIGSTGGLMRIGKKPGGSVSTSEYAPGDRSVNW